MVPSLVFIVSLYTKTKLKCAVLNSLKILQTLKSVTGTRNGVENWGVHVMIYPSHNIPRVSNYFF